MDALNTAHLYRVIQTFLTRKDYLAWMNCSHEKFDSIKRETITYGKCEREVDEVAMIKIFAELGKMGRKVEAPSKQISLRIQEIVPQVMPSIRFAAQHLYSLTIQTHSSYRWELIGVPRPEPVYQDLDFSIFNNISIVKLTGFPGVTKIHSGLQNIQELTLELPDLTEIYNFNSSNSLKFFRFCGLRIIDLPIRSNFGEECKLILQEGEVWPRDSVFHSFTFNLNDVNNFLSLSSLALSGDFLHSHLNLERVMNLKGLFLTHMDISSYAQFPCTFTGYTLRLTNFNLSGWFAESSFSNIKYLQLEKCIGPKQFPDMPMLRHITLDNVSGIQVIRSFPACVNMSLCDIMSLELVDHQPKVKFLTVSKCSPFHHSFDGQFFDVLALNDYPNDIKWARNAKMLNFSGAEHIPSFAGLDQSDIPPNERTCTIDYFEDVDLTALSNMREVMLTDSDSFGSITDSTQLSNIGDLYIRDCLNYVSTSNLHHIRVRLCIDHCESLVNLQGIPTIALGMLPALDDFSGLGNNDHVYVYNVPYLIICAKKYRRVRHDSRLKAELPYASIFDSIRAFTVILNEGEEDFTELEDEEDDEIYAPHIINYSLVWDEIPHSRSVRMW
jgi:hypothetical protein